MSGEIGGAGGVRIHWSILPTIIAAFVVVVAAGVEARLNIAALLAWQGTVKQTLSAEAISQYRVEMTNIEWRLRNLEAGGCK